MQTNHTPGPWSYWPNSCGGVVTQDATANHVATPTRGPEKDANGCLMAAAPDLLAAMPTVGHPGGPLVKVVAHYADGSTQTLDGDVITEAVTKATQEATR